MKFLSLEGLAYFFEKISNKFAEMHHAHTKEDIVGLEEAVVTDDNNGNVSIDFLTGEGTVIPSVSSDSGVVLYRALEAAKAITATGHTEPNDLNSVILSDPTFQFKRLRLYIKAPWAVTCADFPLDEASGATDPDGYGNRLGGIFIPAGDHVNGATKNFVYKIQWCVRELSGIGWQLQCTQAGWLDFGFNGVVEEVTQTPANENGYTKITAENYMTWHQRHNALNDAVGHEGEYNYTIYKVVGYLE